MRLIEDVVSVEYVDMVLEKLKGHEWKPGHAVNEEYRTQLKHNKELRATDHPELGVMLNHLQSMIWKNETFSRFAYPLKGATLRFNKYETEGFYGKHADAPIMGVPPIRSDLSITLFLSNPSDYDGGELVIGGIGYKGKKGSILVYPSYYVHEVRPVTRGERIAAVTWVQSMVRDESKRELLSRFYDLGCAIKAKEGLSDLYTECASVYSNLMRLTVEN